MKKFAFKTLAIVSVFASTLFVSCSQNDDDGGSDIVTPGQEVLSGDLTVNTTLDASIAYRLEGALRVQNGVTLTIPAGTTITADAAAAGADATEVYIAILQGAKIDVQGVPSNPVIMTSTDGEPGDWGGLTICGYASSTAGTDVKAEVGNFNYGGSNDSDNSGSIKNLVVRGTGAQIDSESQYNGISFYSVGSETVVENIAVIDGADDGVEFYGGSVSVKNLYLENNQDDSIDWTEGWNGTVENAYVAHTIAGFSTVVEGDKDNNNPKFINLTAVSSVGGTALQFKKESGATITGLSLSGYSKNIDMKDGGALSNVQIAGEDAQVGFSYAAPATVDPSDWEFVTAISTAVVLNGDVESDVTLDAALSYNLTGAYIVKSGATLTIPAGTKITAEAGGTEVYIAVLQGGKIDIQGTADNPVVISSANGSPSDWGGLTICGYATSTAGVDVKAEVGNFNYGGSNDTDDSGSIKYLVIKGTGAQIDSESQYNGISFYSVGSETVVENIAVIDGADDGVEFYGGSVSVKNLYLENNNDDSIDWTEGWNGGVDNAYVSHTIAGFSTVLEGDKDNNNPTFTNLTAVSTVGGTALQFKKESGATITGLSLSGYSKNIDMKDGGALSNVKIEGADADTSADYDAAATVDVSTWSWISATL